MVELHTRASEWYENNDLEIEAFEHAVAANDIARAEHIVEGERVPLHFRGAGTFVLNWLEALPETDLNAMLHITSPEVASDDHPIVTVTPPPP